MRNLKHPLELATIQNNIHTPTVALQNYTDSHAAGGASDAQSPVVTRAREKLYALEMKES